jgi:streptomycin 6-kinase
VVDSRLRTPVAPESLGEDFAEIVSRIGSELREVVPLTRLTFREKRSGCYRVRFADGRVFKYRSMVSAKRAKTVEHLISRIGSPSIPRVLDRCGTGLLIEFVDGHPARRSDQTHELLVETAGLQGKIHRTAVADLLAGTPQLDIAEVIEKLAQRIQRLVAQQAITEREAEELTELAMSEVPQASEIGVIHCDYCAENLLVSEAVGFYIVDNELIQIGGLDHDLARTWYRWPMSPAERAVYWESYRRHRDPSSFSAFFLFWSINVLVSSALLRVEGGTDRAAVPIRKLGLLARRAQSGSSSEPYLLW